MSLPKDKFLTVMAKNGELKVPEQGQDVTEVASL